MTTAGPPLTAIASALAAPDAEERRQATASLSLVSPADATPLLLRALGDDDWRVRKEATFAAREIGPHAGLLAGLVRALEPSENVGLRNAAVEVLAAFGHAATTAVAQVFERLDADGRKLVVDVLGRSRDPAAVEPLQAALRDTDSNVRHAAIEAIAGLGTLCPEPVETVLLSALENRDVFVRLTALEGLNGLGVAVPWERLAPLFEDPTLRGAAVSAAALSDAEEAPRAVVHALASARGGAFAQALAAVARLAEGPAAGAVGAALRAAGPDLGARLVRIAMGDPVSSVSPGSAEGASALAEAAPFNPDQQRRAALVLAAIARAPGATDAALSALAEEPFVETAQKALVALGPAALPDVVEQLSHAPSPRALSADGVRATLVDVLTVLAHEVVTGGESARVPWKRVFSALRAAVRDEDRRVATSALIALSRLGEADDLRLAAELTASKSPPIAHAAESALAVLTQRFPTVAREFARAEIARDPLSATATTVVGALATAGESGVTEDDLAMLAHAVTAGDGRARRAAVAAVSEVGGASAFEVLSFALADEERDVQIAAARSLGRLCTHATRSRLAAPGSGHTRTSDAPTSDDAARRAAGPTSRPRPRSRDVLDLVGRSGDPDLLAVLVRALGEGAVAPDSALDAKDLIDAIAPLAADPTSPVAMAAVDALGRTPTDAPGRHEALVRATEHGDAGVVRAALLKLAASVEGVEEIARRLGHPSADVRRLAAEILGSPSQFPAGESASLRAHLSQRVAVEPERDVRDAIEGALAALKRHGGVPTS